MSDTAFDRLKTNSAGKLRRQFTGKNQYLAKYNNS